MNAPDIQPQKCISMTRFTVSGQYLATINSIFWQSLRWRFVSPIACWNKVPQGWMKFQFGNSPTKNKPQALLPILLKRFSMQVLFFAGAK